MQKNKTKQKNTPPPPPTTTRKLVLSQKKLTENVPEEARTFDLLDKNLKSTVLNMLKELNEIKDK